MGWDEDALLAIVGLRSPWLDPIAIALSLLGTLPVWLALTLPLGWRLGRRALVRLVLLLLLDALLVGVLKAVIARDRPMIGGRLEVPGDGLDGYAFPSGHASRSAAAAAYLATHGRRWLLFAPYAAAVAWSRLHIGVHWPTDVLAGLVVGGVLGVAATRVFRTSAYVALEDRFLAGVDRLWARLRRPA